MLILRTILLAIEVIVSLLLIGIVLIQKSKSAGGGLGLAFGGGMGETLFGSRAGNVLTRGTIILTIIFLTNTLFLAMLTSGHHERTIMDKMGDSPAPAAPSTAVTPSPSTPVTAPPPGPGAVPTLPGADLGSPTAPVMPAGAPATPVPDGGDVKIDFKPNVVAEPGAVIPLKPESQDAPVKPEVESFPEDLKGDAAPAKPDAPKKQDEPAPAP